MLLLTIFFSKKVCQKEKAFYLCTRFNGQISKDIF